MTAHNANEVIELVHSYPWWLGGVAATAAAALTHPLDVAKVSLQTSKSKNLVHVLRDGIQQRGIRQGAYVGLSASMLRQMTYSLVRFGVYDVVKKKLSSPADGNTPPVWKLMASASVAGLAGGIAGNPADIILVRMISDYAKPDDKRFKYRHCFDGLFTILRQEGPAALFRGLGPNSIRAILMNTSQLATYDIFKNLLMDSTGMQDGIALHFSTSVISGTVATTVCAPFDVVKSRIMSAASKESAMAVVKRAMLSEGPAFMFKGFWPAWIRLGPNTVAVFLIFEQLRNLWDIVQPPTRRIKSSDLK